MPDSVKKLDKSFHLSRVEYLEFVRFSHILTEIPEDAFYYTPVTELRFLEGLKVIGRNNFRGYSGKNCNRVTFPSTLEYILNSNFWGNDLEEIVIPANVKAIFPDAFGCNYKLKEVKFMSDETVVLPGAFRYCKIDLNAIYKAHQLGDRIFGADEVRYDGDTLTYIPPYYCGKLVAKDGTQKIASDINLERFDGITELYLPDSLEYNGKYPDNITVLHASDKTTELYLPQTHKLRLCNWPKNVNKIVAYDCLDDIENLEVPDSVTEISGFRNLPQLKFLSIPDSVIKIGGDSFRSLPMVTSIKIQEKIEFIENGCFSYTGIKHIEMPAGLKGIGCNAFSNNKFLEEVNIPNIVTKIGAGSFSTLPMVTSIKIPEKIEFIENGCFSYTGIKHIEMPAGLKGIGCNAFKGNRSLEEINIPNSVTEIGEGSFSSLPLVTSIDIPNGIEKIEHACFSYTGIKNLILPDGVKEICWEAFMDNKSLEEVTIPASVEVIGKSAFSGCTSLKKITIEGNPTIKFGAFSKCPGYKKK